MISGSWRAPRGDARRKRADPSLKVRHARGRVDERDFLPGREAHILAGPPRVDRISAVVLLCVVPFRSVPTDEVRCGNISGSTTGGRKARGRAAHAQQGCRNGQHGRPKRLRNGGAKRRLCGFYVGGQGTAGPNATRPILRQRGAPRDPRIRRMRCHLRKRGSTTRAPSPGSRPWRRAPRRRLEPARMRACMHACVSACVHARA